MEEEKNGSKIGEIFMSPITGKASLVLLDSEGENPNIEKQILLDQETGKTEKIIVFHGKPRNG